MTTFAGDCAELGDLYPRLHEALGKDTGDTSLGAARQGSVPFNPDVMHALTELAAEIPRAAMRAARLGGEAWPPRSVDVCLVNLPRFHGRLTGLAMARDAALLEAACYHWLRLAKLALRLIDPSWDLPAWVVCTACDEAPRLRHVGAERAILYDAGAPRTVLVRDGYWLCPHCGTTWPQSHWELLIAALTGVIRQAAG